jgi:hypothetical protein
VLRLWDRTRKRDKLIHSLATYNKTNHKLVSSPLKTLLVLGQTTGNTDSLDSPWPGLGGSHHLPPYSILCVAPSHPHPNGFYSRDSQGGVPKLSRFGLPGLWELITPGSNLGLGWGLKKTCSSPQELSNGVSHSVCTHRGQVDSRLFVVGSQIASLTPGPSFDHNLCWRCLNGSCEAIFDIYTSRPFQRYKEHLKARCFDLCNRILKLRESRRTPSSHFWECESHPHACLKVGLRQRLCLRMNIIFPKKWDYWIWWFEFVFYII